MILWCDIKDLV